MPFSALLISLVLLQIKHFLADYYWQTDWMLEQEAQYGQLGGIAHASLHALLSVPALVIAAGGWDNLLAGILFAEFLLHYHIDWVKLKLRNRGDAGNTGRAFWRLVGLDQLAHQLTYIGMIAAVFWLGVGA